MRRFIGMRWKRIASLLIQLTHSHCNKLEISFLNSEGNNFSRYTKFQCLNLKYQSMAGLLKLGIETMKEELREFGLPTFRSVLLEGVLVNRYNPEQSLALPIVRRESKS